MLIMKFGGTSVGSTEAMRQAAHIVREAVAERGPAVVVVSAMSTVTDSLIHAARSAATGDDETHRQVKNELSSKHRQAVEEFTSPGPRRDELLAEIGRLLDDFQNLCHSIWVLREVPPRAMDVVSSLGERMSARIVAALLSEQGVAAQAVEATELILTDDNFGAANPLMDETRERTRARLLPLLENGVTPVVTGFIGATAEGVLTTLGRGGSDYTAGILGACLDADEILIWTDVNGVMTADPRVVPEARTIAQLSYREVAELAYFGAKVLHPKTILPSARRDIPVRILNTFNPDHPGTLIVSQALENGSAKAITAIKGLSLISVEGRGMIGMPDVAARTLTAVARTRSNVLMISQSSSEQNICLAVPAADGPQVVAAIEENLELDIARGNVERVWAQDDIVIVAVVGAGMKGIPGIAAKVFGALGRNHINVIAIAQGSSEFNISLVVDKRDADDAVRYIHAEFGLGE